MKAMSFISGGGKMFELCRILANAVLERGGEEKHLLSLLNPENESRLEQVINVLLGLSRVTPYSADEVLLDPAVAISVKAAVVTRLGSEELALTAIKKFSYKSPVTEAAMGVINTVALLERIAINKDGELSIDQVVSSFALHKLTKVQSIKRVALQSMDGHITDEAFAKLPQDVLVEIMQEPHDELHVKWAARHIDSEETLIGLSQNGKTSLCRTSATAVLKLGY